MFCITKIFNNLNSKDTLKDFHTAMGWFSPNVLI